MVIEGIPEEGTIAVVTTQMGYKYVGVYTHVPGIDYYWRPLLETRGRRGLLVDPVVSYESIGRVYGDL